jgi:hypothetical protein
MKKIFLFASAVFMATIFASCAHDVLDNQPSEKPSVNDGKAITLTVSAVTKDPGAVACSESDGSPLTKIAFGSADANWEEGDKIFLVRSDGTTITLTLTGGAGTTTGSFISTDPVTAGTYIPYAVSATSLSKGFVSVESGKITLNLSNPGGGTLADVLEHDILKGESLTLSNDQTKASITGLTTHILSYLRFRFNCSEKAVSSIGVSSAGGMFKTVTIAANGTVTGSDSSTDAFSVEASADAGCYSGYFAVYDKTTVNLFACAEDEDGVKYNRVVSVKDADYDAGKVYGKTFTLSAEMVNSEPSGTLSSHTWKNLGLSVKWAEFNVGSSSEYSYDRNIDNGSSSSTGIGVPSDWAGWRIPTRAEAEELFYACEREWVTGSNNGVKFKCNDNYVAMGAGGYERWRDDGRDWDYNIGSVVYFYINENTPSNGWYAQIWAMVGSEGNSLGFGSANLGNNTFGFSNYAAMRLVCDY